jgi:hypothetical protein
LACLQEGTGQIELIDEPDRLVNTLKGNQYTCVIATAMG